MFIFNYYQIVKSYSDSEWKVFGVERRVARLEWLGRVKETGAGEEAYSNPDPHSSGTEGIIVRAFWDFTQTTVAIH